MWSAVPAAGGKAMEADMTTPPLDCSGKRVQINALTIGDGEVSAEVLELLDDGTFKPVPDYTRKECKPFTGDIKRAAITWNKHDRLPNGCYLVRVYFRAARLYGFEVAE